VKKDSNSFFSHSLWLIFSHISVALSGLIFWFVSARLYSPEEIGEGSALISLGFFLVFLSSLGIDVTFIRFIPQSKEREVVLQSFLSFSLFILLLLTGIFLFRADLFLPQLKFLKLPFYSLTFFFFVICILTFQVLESIYISFQATHLVFLKNIVQNFLRIFFLFLLMAWGGFGIFSSNCLAAVVGIAISIFFFFKGRKYFKINFKIKFSILKKLLPFSLVNFLNAISLTLPGILFPLIVIALFSKKETGLFYIPWMIYSVWCSFITSINSILLMHASYGKESKELFKKAILFSLLLGMVGFLIFVFLGDKILLIFKKDFSLYSYSILKIFFYSIFFFIINRFYITILNIRKEVFKIGMFSVFLILNLVIFLFLFLSFMRSEAIAYAWLVSNFLGSIYVFIINSVKRKIISKNI